MSVARQRQTAENTGEEIYLSNDTYSRRQENRRAPPACGRARAGGTCFWDPQSLNRGAQACGRVQPAYAHHFLPFSLCTHATPRFQHAQAAVPKESSATDPQPIHYAKGKSCNKRRND